MKFRKEDRDFKPGPRQHLEKNAAIAAIFLRKYATPSSSNSAAETFPAATAVGAENVAPKPAAAVLRQPIVQSISHTDGGQRLLRYGILVVTRRKMEELYPYSQRGFK